MPTQWHWAVPHNLLGPWGVEVWAGEGIEFPPGTLLIPIPLPPGLRVRLCVSLTKGWWKIKKTFHLNLGFGSVPVAQFGEANFTRVQGTVGEVYTNA